jgi:hypothetical protein
MTKKSMREIPCDFITIQQSLQQNYIIFQVLVRFFLCAAVRGDSFIEIKNGIFLSYDNMIYGYE